MNRKILSAVLIFPLFAACFSGCKGKPSAENSYLIETTLEGGSGKAKVQSPSKVFNRNGKEYVQIVFSSRNYDYVIAAGKKYLNEEKNGNSTFTIPVKDTEEPFEFMADTTAMSSAHEIKYTLRFGEKLENGGVQDSENSAVRAGREKNEGQSAGGKKFSSELSENSREEKPLNLTETGEIPVRYSTHLKIEKYGEFRLVKIEKSGRFLVVPENEKVPEGIPEDVVILKKPLNRTYLVSTSAMDLVARLGAVNMLRFAGLKEGDWFVEEAAAAMKNGSLIYAGKYNIPDYERLYAENCSVAVENTMVLHTPQVKEKLEELGIPVLIERSTYEKNPLGRLEWIKLYGTLFDKEAEAEQFFDGQVEKIRPLLENPSAGKTAAFFSVTTGGAVNVRKSDDYFAKMIELAGGKYVPEVKNETETATATINMQMESFYAGARDADILIYNGTINPDVKSLYDLMKKDRLFADFKAVKSGQAYCVDKRLFQESSGMADFITDLNRVMNGSQDGLVYLKRLK